MNSAYHLRVPTLLAVGRPTAPRSSTLERDKDNKQRSSAAYSILSVNVVTRSKRSLLFLRHVMWRPLYLDGLR